MVILTWPFVKDNKPCKVWWNWKCDTNFSFSCYFFIQDSSFCQTSCIQHKLSRLFTWMHFVWFKMPGLDLQVPPWSSKAWCYSTHFRSTLVLFINNLTIRKYVKYKLVSPYKNQPSSSLGRCNQCQPVFWIYTSVSSSSLSENEHVQKNPEFGGFLFLLIPFFVTSVLVKC